MNVRILRGSKQGIAEGVAQIPGEVREAIVFVEEPSDLTEDSPQALFASMEPFAAHAGGADYSREALHADMQSRV